MHRMIAIAAPLLLLSILPAAAVDTRAKLEKFEFFGQWAPHCGRAASPENPRRDAYFNPKGHAVFTENFGEGHQPNVYVVREARHEGPQRLLLRIELNGDAVQDLTMIRRGGLIRTMTNRRVADESVLVRAGIVASNGAPTPWLRRCGEAVKTVR